MKAIPLLLLLTSVPLGQPLESGQDQDVILWKYRDTPGIAMRGRQILAWPAHIGEPPTREQIREWRAEYEAEKAPVEKQQAIDSDNEDMARWVEHLTVELVRSGALPRNRIPQKVIAAINRRRAIRGDEPIP